jgi:hypothetical protein
MVLSPRNSAAQSCQNFDSQCQTNGVCQADGSCTGTPKANGTACDDFNDCTLTSQCQAGMCVSTSTKNTGDPCTFPGLGKCATAGQCEVIAGFGAFCNPGSFVECANKCQLCDPNTGQCTIPMPCGSIPCNTGECNPSTGQCIPGHEGELCDDGNVCTTNTHCQAGLCKSGAVTTPTPTATATPTHAGPTPTQPVGGPCVGDCGTDGQVTVDEILTMVNIALGNAPVSDCEAGDANGDHQITVDEILAAVNYALSGCPAQPSPTATGQVAPTNTPHAGTPTPTKTGQVATPTGSPGATPGGPSVARRAAGAVESSTKALLVIPNVLSMLLGHFPGAGASMTLAPTPGTGSAATQILNLPFTCPSGGGTLKCDQDIVIGFPPSFGPPTYAVTLNNCQVAGTTGTTLTFNGTLTAVGQADDVCGTVPTNVTVSIPNLTMQAQSPAGSSTTTFTGFSAALLLTDAGSAGSCMFDTVDLSPSGSISVATTGPPATSTQLTFNSGSDVSISVSQYGDQCVPQIYDLELNGDVTLTADGQSFRATYTTYDLSDDTTVTAGQDTVDISGTVDSPCFGGSVDVSTFNSLSLNGGACPIAGDVEVTTNATGDTDLVSYTASGGVTIDLGDDDSIDQTFPTCLNSELFVCPVS